MSLATLSAEPGASLCRAFFCFLRCSSIRPQNASGQFSYSPKQSTLSPKMEPHGKSGSGAGGSSAPNTVGPIPTIYTNTSTVDQKKALKEKMAKEESNPLPEQPWGDLLNAKFHHLIGSFKENTIKVYESSPSRTMRLVAVFAGLLLLAAVISLVIAQRDQSMHGKFRIGFPLEEITVTERPYQPLPSALAQEQSSSMASTTKFLNQAKTGDRPRFSDSIASSTDGPTFTSNDASAVESESNDSPFKKSVATIVITASHPSDDLDDQQGSDDDSLEDTIEGFNGRVQRPFRMFGRFGAPSNDPLFSSNSAHPRMMLIERLMGVHLGSSQPASQSGSMSSSAQSLSIQRLIPTENSNKIEDINDSDGGSNLRILIHGPASSATSDSMDDRRTRPIDRLHQFEKSVLDRAAAQAPAEQTMDDAPMLLRYAAASMLSRLVAAAAAASNSPPSGRDSYPNNDDTNENQLEMAAERISRLRSQEDEPEEETVPVLLATVGQHMHSPPQSMISARPTMPVMMRPPPPPFMSRPRLPPMPYGPMRSPFAPRPSPPSASITEQRDASAQQPMIVMLAVPVAGAADSQSGPNLPSMYSPFNSMPSPPSTSSHYYGPYAPSMYRSMQWMQQRSPFYAPSSTYGVAPPPPPPPPHPSALGSSSNPSASGPIPIHARPPMYHPQSHIPPPYPPNPYYSPAVAHGPPHSPMYTSPGTEPKFSHSHPGYAYYPSTAATHPGVGAAFPITNKPGPIRPPFSYFGQPVANQDEQPEPEQHMIVLYDADSSANSQSAPSSNSVDTNERDDDSSAVPAHARQALHQLIMAAASAADAARQRQQSASANGPSATAPQQIHWRPPVNMPIRSSSGPSPIPSREAVHISSTMSQRPSAAQIPMIRAPFGRPVEFPIRSIAEDSSSNSNSEPQESDSPRLEMSAPSSHSGLKPSEAPEIELRLPARPITINAPERPSFAGQPLVAPVRIDSTDDSNAEDQPESEISPFSHFAQIIRSVVEQQHQQEQQEQQQSQQSQQTQKLQPQPTPPQAPQNAPSIVRSPESIDKSSNIQRDLPSRTVTSSFAPSSSSSPSSSLSSTQSPIDSVVNSNNDSSSKSDDQPAETADQPESASSESIDTDGLERESKQSQPIAQESVRRPAFIVVAEPEDSK